MSRVKHHRNGFFGKHKAIKITLLSTLAIIVIILGIGTFMYHKAQSLVQNSYVPANNKKLRDTDSLLNAKRPISVLLLGTDTGAQGRVYKGRTDTMMLMTLNPAKQATTITSIPRDMKVDIPGFKQFSPAKINAAYAYGSAGTAMSTVQNVVGNPVDFYVLVNMGGLETAIDEVNGVDVVSPLTFNFGGNQFNKGQSYHMNGKMALAFSRMRHEDPQGDYGRQTRQRLVLMALIQELKKPSNITNTKLLETLTNNVQTDLQFSQLQTLLLNYRDVAKHVSQDHVQGQGQMINGQAFEVVSDSEQSRVAAKIASALQQ